MPLSTETIEGILDVGVIEHVYSPDQGPVPLSTGTIEGILTVGVINLYTHQTRVLCFYQQKLLKGYLMLE